MEEVIGLPVDALLGDICATLRSHRNLVLEAPPGAGKTTRVPPALLRETAGEIMVLEPRRLAARMAARRVAEEMGQRVGDTVGYQVRFEEVVGAGTRLRFVTEGILTRRMLSDPELRGVSTVILDEFHERHLDGDLALARLLHLQRTRRPDLRLVVMSATLDAAPIAEHLGDSPVLRSEGRLFPMDIQWTPDSVAPIEERVAAALDRLSRNNLTGDVLVFLPGATEMRRTARLLESRAGEWLIAQLHGDLSPQEQDQALAPSSKRKVILSTNVAESSITIEGVTVVIDSGLARVAVDSPWTGIPSLEVTRISQASATQRAGRSARTAPGRVIRLYSQEDFLRRPKQDAPEITRRELSEMLLDLHSGGNPDALSLPWLTPPPAEHLEAAWELLRKLGALEGEDLSPLGRRMARLPVHPRLARLVLEAQARGATEQGIRAAAVLSAGERLEGSSRHVSDSDVFTLLEKRWQPQTSKIVEQIRRALDRNAQTNPASGTLRTGDEPLLIAITAAFSDRLGRPKPNGEVVLSVGGAAQLSEQSSVRNAGLVVALDIETRRDRGLPLVRLASKVDPEWLLDLFPGRMDAFESVEWNRTAERVERVSGLSFDGLVIEETRSGDPDPERAAGLLAAKAMEVGIERFAGREEWELLLSRWRFAAMHGGPPVPDTDRVRDTVMRSCYGLRAFSDLRGVLGDGGLQRILFNELPAGERELIDRLAPERIKLPAGRSVRVNYVDNQPPWIASRLQDFFGMTQTPRIGGGSVSVVVHLLAPNQRPVQMTQDLSGFWLRLYPQLRKELSRRYPRHHWPESPDLSTGAAQRQ